MPFMTRNKATILIIFWSGIVYSQTNNLTGSPYSFFGLGVPNFSKIGNNAGYSGVGISRGEDTTLNDLNPASIGRLNTNYVVLDLGGFLELETLRDNANTENRFSGNFSSVGVGFHPGKKWGASIVITPATNVGYTLFGLTTQVEGSNEEFYSNIFGSGGMNTIDFDIAFQATESLSLGVKSRYLFGNVDETENVVLNNSFLTIEESNNYRNFQFGFGLLYKFLERFELGATLQLETSLDGLQDRTVIRSLDFSTPSIADQDTDIPIADFIMPLEYGIGLSTTITDRAQLHFDFKRSLWEDTNQADGFGNYIDRNVYGLAFEYGANLNQFANFWDRVSYRFGATYDSGYLDILGTNVSSYRFSLGVGIPISRFGSMINIGYNYTHNGEVTNVLIEEQIHTLSFNISLVDIWFRKSYYD